VTVRLLAGATLLAVVGFGLGTVWGGPIAFVVTVLVAGGAATGYRIGEDRRLRRAAQEINGWMTRTEHRGVELRGSHAWEELSIAINALGAAHQRRGARLARERPWRRELVDSLVQPALLFSDEGRMLAANDAARELLGIALDAEDLTVMQAVGTATLAEAVRVVRERGRPVTVDAEQGDRELRAVVTMVGDETLVIIDDRTHERRVEELRRNFVVNASHELKTPVTGIQTLAEALQVTLRNDPDRAPALVTQLNGEAERLVRLVSDLLDLRRLEERGPLERVPVDLAELVRRAVAEAVPRAERRGVELSVDGPDHAFVSGLPGDLELIVENLVANGVKYNRPGGSVNVSLEPAHGTYVLRVTDTGIGIPQHDLGRIFERFYRIDSARSRETGGTGLGLSIVRHAAELHGGSISVESLLGEGTTFTVTLPVGPMD
jgi:signal transduction histidine kinase